MWNGTGPKPDGRHGRTLITDLSEKFADFFTLHDKVKEMNDAGYQCKANDARVKVIAACSRIFRERPKFPSYIQRKFDNVAGRVTGKLKAASEAASGKSLHTARENSSELVNRPPKIGGGKGVSTIWKFAATKS